MRLRHPPLYRGVPRTRDATKAGAALEGGSLAIRHTRARRASWASRSRSLLWALAEGREAASTKAVATTPKPALLLQASSDSARRGPCRRSGPGRPYLHQHTATYADLPFCWPVREPCSRRAARLCPHVPDRGAGARSRPAPVREQPRGGSARTSSSLPQRTWKAALSVAYGRLAPSVRERSRGPHRRRSS